MSPFRFGQISIDPVALGSAGNAVLGIRDSGKTYSATFFAEQLFESGIPFVAFDPIGVWRFLRVPGRGRGYPIVVAGGQHGDLPLSPHSAPAIVEAAMQNGVSLVIDLFTLELSKADWKRIVRDCIRLMLHRNQQHGLRHIFLEEAAEFAPQILPRGDSGPGGEVYAEIEKLARMGGNARLGYTLINQRAEEVNKAVLELCDNLFLHRQKGRNSLTALSKWLDIGAVKDHKQIIDTLSTLPTGECWAWLAGTERPVHVKVPAKNSLHPDRRVMRGDADAQAKPAVDVGQFVETMRGTLKDVEEEAKANDPKALRARIRELEQTARGAGAAPEELAAAEARGFERGKAEGLRLSAGGFESLRGAVREARAAVASTLDELEHGLDTWQVQHGAALSADGDTPAHHTIDRRIREPISSPAAITYGGGRHEGNAVAADTRAGIVTDKAQRAFLTVLAQRGRALTRNQIAILAGYSSKSSHVDNTISACRTRGFIVGGRDRIEITADGRKALGRYTPLPTGTELQAYWVRELDGAGAKFLTIICAAHPRTLTRDQVAEKAGYSTASSHVDNTLSALRTRGLITGGRDALKASEELFD